MNDRNKTHSPLKLTQSMIDQYADSLARSGLSAGTLSSYRRKLKKLYTSLPEDKTIYPDTLEKLTQEYRNRGYSNQTVNIFLAATNGLLEFCDRRDLQYKKRMEKEDHASPDLTRTEYLQLLAAAKHQGNQRTYLIVKAIAATGMDPQEIIRLDVESVRRGRFEDRNKSYRIPVCVREELLRYVETNEIDGGPIFLSKRGKPLARTQISNYVSALSEDANVDSEKCTPRSLKRLHHSTQQALMEPLRQLLEDSHDRMLEMEQMSIGWEEE